jgi:gamma-glutamylcyclotransferase (GGCT)/AIG2-like uncharacterized protein YtfP
MNNVYLFVYGTLRKDYGFGLMQQIADKIALAGQGWINAMLYDLGSYPAAVVGLQQNEITGDVYEVLDVEQVFSVLDDYEGPEYKREKVDVRMETGDVLKAWVYWYAGKLDKTLRIEENDYLNYLKNKKDRFV